jgi:hypothetical protein
MLEVCRGSSLTESGPGMPKIHNKKQPEPNQAQKPKVPKV